MQDIEKWMNDTSDTSFDAIYMPYYRGGVGMPVKFFFRNGVIHPDGESGEFNPELDDIVFGVYANSENLQKSSPLLLQNGTFTLDLEEIGGWIYASPNGEGVGEYADTIATRKYARLILITLEEYNALCHKKRELHKWSLLSEQRVLPTKPIYEDLL